MAPLSCKVPPSVIAPLAEKLVNTIVAPSADHKDFHRELASLAIKELLGARAAQSHAACRKPARAPSSVTLELMVGLAHREVQRLCCP